MQKNCGNRFLLKRLFLDIRVLFCGRLCFCCMALIVAMALFTAGCGKKGEDAPSGAGQDTGQSTGQSTSQNTDESTAQSTAQNTDESTGQTAGTVYEDGSSLGEGSTKFSFTVTDKDGNETHLEIHTDKETVGDALLELGLIAGDDGDYGLYVKTVNGITADYDTDGVYWAFYVNGEYATSGVDSTPVTEGADYAFKVE